MKLALTYDDGPNPPYTLELLEVLARHRVHATFFMLGKFVLDRPGVVLEVAAAGHQIGNHTFSHPSLPELPEPDVKEEIRACEAVLTQLVGPHSGLFRPPFMLSSPKVETAVSESGLISVGYKAAGGDATQRGADFIVDKVDKELDGQSGIILLHDGCHLSIGISRKDTVAATDQMITRYKAVGVEFVFPTEVD